MSAHYITTINETNKHYITLLINASLQAYNAFDASHPMECQTSKITAPDGYEFVDYWTGVDSIFSHDKQGEVYGVIFRTTQAPYEYIFSFRGTTSLLDMIDDLGVESCKFSAFKSATVIPQKVTVESGFYDVYTSCSSQIPSMQSQLFEFIERFQKSDKPIHRLLITGHSLGAALSELFTLDIALSDSAIIAQTINFASPRVGNQHFVDFYMQQPAQKNHDTQTLRVQNTYDIVPCLPPKEFGYQHIPQAYLIAFYKDCWSGKLDFIDSHSALNYQAVVKCASKNEQGICTKSKLPVPMNHYSINSFVPDTSTVCHFTTLNRQNKR